MNIAIIGAGIGGLAAGIALRKKGFEVQIYERAPSFKPIGTGIAIAANAMAVFADLGIAEAVAAAGNPIDFACMGRPDGSAIAKVDTKKLSATLGFTTIAIHRADLHDVLAGAFGHDRIHCDSGLASVEETGARVRATFTNGQSVDADILVGADGLRSRVRECVFGESPLRSAEQSCWRGIVDRDAMNRPDRVIRGEAWELWGRGARFGYAMVNARQIYWYAVISDAVADFAVEDTAAFRRKFAPMWNETVRDMLTTTPDSTIIAAPLMDRLPSPAWHTDRVVLLGDAIHPTTPNMGQGACMAIESAWALAHCLSVDPNPRAAFTRYHAMRAARTRTITTQSFRMGRLFQTMSPMKAQLRDFVFSHAPAALQERAMVKLLSETPLRAIQRSV